MVQIEQRASTRHLFINKQLRFTAQTSNQVVGSSSLSGRAPDPKSDQAVSALGQPPFFQHHQCGTFAARVSGHLVSRRLVCVLGVATAGGAKSARRSPARWVANPNAAAAHLEGVATDLGAIMTRTIISLLAFAALTQPVTAAEAARSVEAQESPSSAAPPGFCEVGSYLMADGTSLDIGPSRRANFAGGARMGARVS